MEVWRFLSEFLSNLELEQNFSFPEIKHFFLKKEAKIGNLLLTSAKFKKQLLDNK